jgi:hypothetical protein
MNREQFGKLWTILGTTTAYLLLNAWLVSQQAKITLPGIDFTQHNDGSAAALGMVIGGVSLWAVISVWRIYLRSFPGASICERVPSMAGWEYDTGSPIVRRVQLCFLVFFLILPLASLVHLNGQVYQEKIHSRHEEGCSSQEAGMELGRLTTPIPFRPWDYCYQLGEKGIQYHPFWQDWALLLWNLLLQWRGWSLLWRIVRGPAAAET